MTRLIPLLLLLSATGCASAAPAADHSANCADWDSMRRGVVSCEVGDQCMYDVGELQFDCACGADGVHLFWCHQVAAPTPEPVTQALPPTDSETCELDGGTRIGTAFQGAEPPAADCQRMANRRGEPAKWCCP